MRSTFLQGLAVLIPVGLTLYFAYWLLSSMEGLMRPVVVWIFGEESYLTGMGLILAVGVVLLAGALMQIFLVERLFRWGESVLQRVPGVKSIYHALKDFIQFMTQGGDAAGSRVVAVEVGDETLLVGLVTNEKPDDLVPADAGVTDLVAVYFPMSYMIGGYTLLVPRERLRNVDLKVEDAMRLLLTGGVRAA